MTKSISILILSTLNIVAFGQSTIQTKEVTIKYTNAREVFRICTSNCQTTFDDKKEYFWYTEFSKIKSTKGGSGGSLLHGNYKFYDENGNLRHEKNYYLGLPEGNEKRWDSLGNITDEKKYNKGEMENVYMKFQNDEKIWIEYVGDLFKDGSIKRAYSTNNSLLSEITWLPNFHEHIKIFYEKSGKLKEDYTTNGYWGDFMSGKYTHYYENGKVDCEGQWYDGEGKNIKVGAWKFYKLDGTPDGTDEYKANIEFGSNGQIKVAGGYILNPVDNSWVMTGEWRWYDDEGKVQSIKNYEQGVEIQEKK